MNKKIETKESFQIIGFSTFIKHEEGYIKCPEFWKNEYSNKYKNLLKTKKPKTLEEKAVIENNIGMLAVCIDGKESFEYMIGGFYCGGEIPKNMKLLTLPKSDWVIFSTKGQLPQSLQSLNTYIWNQWFPTDGKLNYIMNGNLSIEYYSSGDTNSIEYESEIWIPVKLIK